MLLNGAASLVIGSTTLSGTDVTCVGRSRPETCRAVQVVFAVVLVLGLSSGSLFAAVNALLVFFAMPRKQAVDPIAKKLET
ncbi:hypothetical protein EON66_04620 [archaeon]|nr:MAG: hypothetical protein EON66_04620 [archaeon]